MKPYFPYSVRVTSEFAEELEAVRAYDRGRIRQAIGRLAWEAVVETKHRKLIDLARLGRPLPFAHEPPVWQLAVGPWRVFYDVAQSVVIVRALRRKDAHEQTEEIL